MDQPQKTNAFWKLANSIVNVSFVFLLSIPLLLLFGFNSIEYKVSAVLLFLTYQLIVAFSPKKVDFGDFITRTRWLKKYPCEIMLLSPSSIHSASLQHSSG